eukprot:3861558-Pyramimonas_sp.AAC.1
MRARLFQCHRRRLGHVAPCSAVSWAPLPPLWMRASTRRPSAYMSRPRFFRLVLEKALGYCGPASPLSAGLGGSGRLSSWAWSSSMLS